MKTRKFNEMYCIAEFHIILSLNLQDPASFNSSDSVWKMFFISIADVCFTKTKHVRVQALFVNSAGLRNKQYLEQQYFQ